MERTKKKYTTIQLTFPARDKINREKRPDETAEEYLRRKGII